MALKIHARFFEREGKPFFLRAVTYGPFPPNKLPDPAKEFPRIAEAGFNAIRTYETPGSKELDLAAENGLVLIPVVPWHWDSLFTENPNTLGDAKRDLAVFLARHGTHQGLGALLVANEIRPDLVRFMGPAKVRETLEDLIDHCHQQAPELPVAYANFPTTEYLEPRNADFTAFNVYLEETSKFESYLRRLHNIAGDRPLLLAEFGYSTWKEGTANQSDSALEDKQQEVLDWAYRSAREEFAAGFTVYSWCDLWFNGGSEVEDWSFGLTRRDGTEKPALAHLSKLMHEEEKHPGKPPLITVAICTRNGGQRLRENLPHFENISDSNYEVIVVDDGSEDETASIVQQFFAQSSLTGRLLSQNPGGLSEARNHAAREGKGEFIVYIDDDARPHSLWLTALRRAFSRNPRAVAAGGPNLAPAPHSLQNALVTACRGNASHILFDDTTAEHLPGCNFALRREVLLETGGFDKRFHAAGDDVDVCWRLLDEGHELAFHPAACVFHDRRATILAYIHQQRGYGEAEALLYQKHPKRFRNDSIRWEGFIYSGAPLTVDSGSIIYHGPMGEAPFQMLHLSQMPVRPLARGFNTPWNRKLVRALEWLSNWQRRRTRKAHGGPVASWQVPVIDHRERDQATREDFPIATSAARDRILCQLLKQGWKVAKEETEADLQRGPIRLLFAETIHSADSATIHLRVLHPPVSIEEILSDVKDVVNAIA